MALAMFSSDRTSRSFEIVSMGLSIRRICRDFQDECREYLLRIIEFSLEKYRYIVPIVLLRVLFRTYNIFIQARDRIKKEKDIAYETLRNFEKRNLS